MEDNRNSNGYSSDEYSDAHHSDSYSSDGYSGAHHSGGHSPDGYSGAHHSDGYSSVRHSSDGYSSGGHYHGGNNSGAHHSGDHYSDGYSRQNRYAPQQGMPTSEKQKEYYRRLANERNNAKPENYQPAHSSPARQPSPQPAPRRTGNPNGAQYPRNPQRSGGGNPGGPKKKKKMSGGKKALISIICILLVLILAVAGTGLYYLNKINFDDGDTLTLAPVDPNGEEDEEEDILNGELSADEKDSLADANASINANLDDKKIWYSEDVTNILLMGIDYGSSGFPYGRSDSMIIVSINNATKKVKLVSLSRAVYAAIPGYSNTRLSHAHGYGGPRLAIQAIQNNYKIRIDNYASVTFQGFENIINALGGVTVSLDANEAQAISHLLGSSSAGTYDLNGAQALAFARTRKIDNDRSRTGRQRRVLEALAAKAKTMSVPQMISAMDDVLPNVTTDMSRTQLISMLSKAFTYLGYSREEEVIPHKSSDLTMRGGFEVLLVDWADEVPYVHKVFYDGVEAKEIVE